MILTLITSLSILTLIFSAFFFKDLINHKEDFEKQTSYLTTSVIGFITNFFDTLGIGSFAPLTALLRGLKQIQDKVLPGTLNVSVTIPVMIEAFVFIRIIEVEKITLFTMVVGATVGSAFGATIVSKLSEKIIQRIMGIALMITAFLMLSGQMGWIKELGVGTAIGLEGIKLVIAVLVNVALGFSSFRCWHVCPKHGSGLRIRNVSCCFFSDHDGFIRFCTSVGIDSLCERKNL